MNEPIVERDALWDEFLAKWPIERLQKMTLEEYSKAGDKECFTYWLEARTEGLGSIWGGSAFKFGIYGRKDRTSKPSTGGVIYGADYAWVLKRGATQQLAFEKLRELIVSVAQAVQRGDLLAVENIVDLGPATKWKIAFLYQNRQHPLIVNIYKLEHLRALVPGGKKESAAALYRQLAKTRGTIHVLQQGDQLWGRIQEIEAARLTVKAAQEILELADFNPILHPPVDKMAGYQSGAGRQLVLALDSRYPLAFYLSAGEEWLAAVSHMLSSIEQYPADKRRQDSLGVNAPQLAQGNAIVKVKVATPAVLSQLLEVYSSPEGDVPEPPLLAPTGPSNDQVPLNQIFFGPPGTGKTHRMVEEAVRIVDPKFHAANAKNRQKLKTRYDELVNDHSVRFVTFHQSFAYEDFVEGLRPVVDEEQKGPPRYEVMDGIFKSICIAAEPQLTKRVEASSINVHQRKIWKMSLGNTQNDESMFYQECIDGGDALLGYGFNVDFSGVRSVEDIRSRYAAAGYDPKTLTEFAVTSVAVFMLQVQAGDLLVVTDGNFKFRAIGEVTGDYAYAPRTDWDGFAQKRAVRWLRVYSPSQPSTELMKKQFVQRTIYRLHPDSIDLDRLQALLSGRLETQAPGARVLVIDEINRSNISRVFGELITLIEASKRKGEPEALEVTLPYSKDPFSVPSNIYLIGTMNTADRSLTGLDIALRRRFSFIEVPPRPELLKGVVIEEKIDLGELLSALNDRIELLLDRDHCIGHACFLQLKNSSPLSELSEVFRRQVIPLLQEYFFEDWGRIRLVLNDHRKKDRPEHCFLVRPKKSVEALIGAEDMGMREDKRWVLNDSAFNFADSYVETIGD